MYVPRWRLFMRTCTRDGQVRAYGLRTTHAHVAVGTGGTSLRTTYAMCAQVRAATAERSRTRVYEHVAHGRRGAWTGGYDEELRVHAVHVFSTREHICTGR